MKLVTLACNLVVVTEWWLDTERIPIRGNPKGCTIGQTRNALLAIN